MSYKMIKWKSSDDKQEYFMDVNAFLETRDEAKKHGFQHPCHDHLLELKEVFMDSTKKICDGCDIFIRGSAYYTCSICDFDLHEFCAHLPQNMTHLILDEDKCQHILKLTSIKASEIRDSKDNKCNICDEKVFGPTSSIYRRPTNYRMICYKCSEDDCKFVVDLRCVASVFTVKDPGHRHVLAPRLYPASFLCSICGEIDDDDKKSLFYLCNECPFMVHDTCYPLPRTIQHATHPHPLLIMVFDSKYRLSLKYCGICHKSLDDKYWWYECPACSYIIHVQCSFRKRNEMVLPKLDEEELKSIIKLSFLDKKSLHQTLTQLVRKLCNSEEEEESSSDHNVLHHPNHDCPLGICETNADNSQVCDACVLPIREPPFYACHVLDSCKFFLHKWCANLPKELKITHHKYPEHTFVLVEKEIDRLGFHRCKMCDKVGNGFFFQCRECGNYYIDIKCASLPNIVLHDSHDHPLLLLETSENPATFRATFLATCYCCVDLKSEYVYGCVYCHVFLHVKCLWVPQKIEHWYDEHPFSLVYNWPVAISGDELDDYFCEFCEITIKENYWFYRCSECDQSTHISCLGRDLYPMLKFGKLYYVYNIHQHPLKCIMVPSKDLHGVIVNPCSFCVDSNHARKEGGGEELIFECFICKILLHPECVDPSLGYGELEKTERRMRNLMRLHERKKEGSM